MKNYIRNILIFFVTFSLVLGLCLVPSFADYSNGFILLSSFQSIPSVSDVSEYLYSSNGNNLLIAGTTSNQFVFCVGNSFYFAQIDNVQFNFYYGWSNSELHQGTSSSFSFNSNYNLYYRSNGFVLGSSTLNPNLISFASVDVALAAIRDYIDNPPVTETTYNAYFDIPCGNVAYIKTGNNNTLTLSCTMPEYSKLTGSTGTYWTNTMQIAYGVPTYPPAGTTYPLSNMAGIQWFRSSEGRDLLGRTKKALFLDTTHATDNFIVIYNPTYRELTTSGQGDINPTIRVRCSELIDYHIYSLTGEYNSNGTISSYSIDGFSDPYVGTPTSDNEEVTGTNSSGSTPNVGGTGNEIGGDGGIIQYIQSIQKTLDTFANSFINLMKAPISHIQSLIASGTDYFNMIRGLYSWLPDEVQGTINSAMIVSISVGVIALLL